MWADKSRCAEPVDTSFLEIVQRETLPHGKHADQILIYKIYRLSYIYMPTI